MDDKDLKFKDWCECGKPGRVIVSTYLKDGIGYHWTECVYCKKAQEIKAKHTDVWTN